MLEATAGFGVKRKDCRGVSGGKRNRGMLKAKESLIFNSYGSSVEQIV